MNLQWRLNRTVHLNSDITSGITRNPTSIICTYSLYRSPMAKTQRHHHRRQRIFSPKTAPAYSFGQTIPLARIRQEPYEYDLNTWLTRPYSQHAKDGNKHNRPTRSIRVMSIPATSCAAMYTRYMTPGSTPFLPSSPSYTLCLLLPLLPPKPVVKTGAMSRPPASSQATIARYKSCKKLQSSPSLSLPRRRLILPSLSRGLSLL